MKTLSISCCGDCSHFDVEENERSTLYGQPVCWHDDLLDNDDQPRILNNITSRTIHKDCPLENNCMKEPRQYSLVKLDNSNEETKAMLTHYYNEFDGESLFIYMGEMPNMRGHCVIAGYHNGKVYSGYHLEMFVEVED